MSREQKPTTTKVPDGQARFLTTRQKAAERKGVCRFRNRLGAVPEGSRIQDAEEAVGMPCRQLVPPHGSDSVKPLLLPRGRTGRGPQARRDAKKNSARLARGLRRVHAGNGRLYAARRLHGARRLAQLLPGHETDAAACSGRSRSRFPSIKTLPMASMRRGGRARRRGDRRHPRRHGMCARNIRSTSGSRPNTSIARPTRSIPASPRCWRRETSTWRGR